MTGTPEEMQSWAMEIQQVRTAMQRTHRKLVEQEAATAALRARLMRQITELDRQETRWRATVRP